MRARGGGWGGLLVLALGLGIFVLLGTVARFVEVVLPVVAVLVWTAAGLLLVWLVLVRRQPLGWGRAVRGVAERWRGRVVAMRESVSPQAPEGSGPDYVVLTRSEAEALGLWKSGVSSSDSRLEARPEARVEGRGDGSIEARGEPARPPLRPV